MSLSAKKWVWPADYSSQAQNLAAYLQISPALARLLINRGIDDPGQAGVFLAPSLDQLHDPWLMLGMHEAVERIIYALDREEEIYVHGDYDADGIAASVIMIETLRRLGGAPHLYLPSRFEEGYGLHLEALKQFQQNGASLVITVDCGITAFDEAAYAKKIGLDLIVTDHHKPQGKLDGPSAVLNPLQENCPYPYKELAGAGVAFKLASALFAKKNQEFPSFLLDLAALGTTADVVPLLGENRIIVAHGLAVLKTMKRVGFRALSEAVSLASAQVNSTTLAFNLAPAINAAGRMGQALPAAQLLLEKDQHTAAVLAAQLHQANQDRRKTEQAILTEAEAAALEQMESPNNYILTLASDHWHHGVIGIVASRIVERFNRPAVLIAFENGKGRGSARSIPGFDITAALTRSAHLLERFGGHEQAAGFSINEDKLISLRQELNQSAASQLTEADLKGMVRIDAELEAAEISFDLIAELNQLQPYGTANPTPQFVSRNWEILAWRLVGADQKHLKLKVRQNEQTLDPIFFSGASVAEELAEGRHIDLLFRLKTGTFRNQKTLDLLLQDIRFSDAICDGKIAIQDQRNCTDRLRACHLILEQVEGKAVVFTATGARAKQLAELKEQYPALSLLSSGSANGNGTLPDQIKTVILYDLPLTPELVKPLIDLAEANSFITFYLLFRSDDLQRNKAILRHSIPTASQLASIRRCLENSASPFDLAAPQGALKDCLGFKPAPSFWQRVAAIFSESGLTDSVGQVHSLGTLTADWTTTLHKSPTYLAAQEQLKQCDYFQQQLLIGRPEEIARLLADL